MSFLSISTQEKRSLLPSSCTTTANLPDDYIKSFSNINDYNDISEEHAEIASSPMLDAEYNSIYIPQLPPSLSVIQYKWDETTNRYINGRFHRLDDENDFKYLFEEFLWVGKVKRVDFVVRDGKKCAFVHFHHWFNNSNAKIMQNTINNWKSAKIKSFATKDGFYHVQSWTKTVGKGGTVYSLSFPFLSFKRNFKVIPECTETVEPNIHQVIHWNAELEKTVAEQKTRIQELEEMLATFTSEKAEKMDCYNYTNNCQDCEKEYCVCNVVP